MPVLECFTSQDAIPMVGVTDIQIVRGDDAQFEITFRRSDTLELVNFTGWTFLAKAKAAIDGADWSDAVVTHGGVLGTVLVTFPKAETMLLTPDAVGVWDLQGTDPGGLVRTIRRGGATVIGDVTD